MLQLTKLVLICAVSRAMSRLAERLHPGPDPTWHPGPVLPLPPGPGSPWPESSTAEVPRWFGGDRRVTIPVVPSVAPTYGPWSTWGRCSKSCGGGSQGRTRKYCTSRSDCIDNWASRKCNSHACPVCRGEWTVWFDRDNPSGNGDYETFHELRKERKLEMCVAPSAIDGRVVRLHTNWYQAGDVVTASITRGLSCINKNQKHKRLCKDYEVRFCCPKIQSRKNVEIMATAFLKTIHSVSGGGNKPGGPGGKAPPPRARCSDHQCVREDFVDSNHMLRMVSRRVIRRQQREAINEVLMRKKRQTQDGSVKTKRDVLFLIDESGSVGSDNFEKFKGLTQAIIKTFCGKIDIGEAKTRVAVHSFDFKQHHHMNFKDYFGKQQVLSGIDSVAYDHTTDHSTCLIESLQYSRESLFTPSRGARMQQPDTEQLLVLLSDGCANCKQPQSQRAKLLEDVAEKLSQQGIAIFTIFVAPHSASSTSCVDKIVPLNDGTYCYQTFRLYSWDEVDIFSNKIKAAGCTEEWEMTEPCSPSPTTGSSTERGSNEEKRVLSPPPRSHVVPQQQALPRRHTSLQVPQPPRHFI